jgi:hypothetical protein
MATAELSRAIKSYIVADEKLATLRTSSKEVRGQIKVLTDEISQAMLAADLNIVRVPNSNCEIELKAKEAKKKEAAAVKRVREVIEPLRGKVLTPDIETSILAAAAPPPKDNGDDGDDEENGGAPRYMLKRRKLRSAKTEPVANGQ